jgi:hypothetical protein
MCMDFQLLICEECFCTFITFVKRLFLDGMDWVYVFCMGTKMFLDSTGSCKGFFATFDWTGDFSLIQFPSF